MTDEDEKLAFPTRLGDLELKRGAPQGPSQYLPAKDRLNVTVYIVQERRGEDPFVIESRGAHLLENDEDSVKKRITIPKGQKISLDLKWLDGKVGLVVIKNVTGWDLVTNPTSEQRAAIDSTRVFINHGGGRSYIDPEKSPIMFSPEKPSEVALESPEGDAVVRIWITPS